MTTFDVVFSPRSERHLVSIYRQIATTSGPVRAEGAVTDFETHVRLSNDSR